MRMMGIDEEEGSREDGDDKFIIFVLMTIQMCIDVPVEERQ